jgi:hypothetical protein
LGPRCFFPSSDNRNPARDFSTRVPTRPAISPPGSQPGPRFLKQGPTRPVISQPGSQPDPRFLKQGPTRPAISRPRSQPGPRFLKPGPTRPAISQPCLRRMGRGEREEEGREGREFSTQWRWQAPSSIFPVPFMFGDLSFEI